MTTQQQAAIYRGPRSDEYETPGWLWDPLHAQYGFKVDLAARELNTKLPAYYSAQDSFLRCDGYDGCAWLNPPFSLAPQFFCKLDRLTSDRHKAVAIYKSGNMETAAWEFILRGCAWIAHPKVRVEYLVDGKRVLGPDGKPSGVQFASAVIGWNVAPPIAPVVPWPHTLFRVDRRWS